MTFAPKVLSQAPCVTTYLVLTDRILLQQELVHTTHFQYIAVLILKHTQSLLLRTHVHEPCPSANGLSNDLLWAVIVGNLHRVLLSLPSGRHNPDTDDDLAAFCNRNPTEASFSSKPSTSSTVSFLTCLQNLCMEHMCIYYQGSK